MSKYKDFDAFFSQELKREPVRLTLFGESHELPPALPAIIMLKVLRMQKDGVGQVPESEVLMLAEAIFGAERLDKWATRLDVEQLGELISWAISCYTGGSEENPRKAAKAKR